MLSRKNLVSGVETVAALVGTALSAMLLVLAAVNAGPLWRDETNSFNMVQMPSLKDIWDNMQFESFPFLWLLLLRGLSFLGVLGSDAGIRVLGLCVGLCFLLSLWLCARWMGGRAPTLSIALLGALPAFIFVTGANRAYGLAGCLLVLSFGLIWRVLELPSKSRILWAGLVCLLFVQCVYYDSIFLCAMLAGGALVALRRRQWKTLCVLLGIGALSGLSMLIYLPVFHRGSVYTPMIRDPFFAPSTLWYGLCNALAARSSANPDGAIGPPIWIWVELLMAGIIVALVMQRTRARQAGDREKTVTQVNVARSDLALYSAVSVLSAIAGCFEFFLNLQYFMQAWYYIGLLSLWAISLDGILSANWQALRPWGLFRIGFLVGMMALSIRAAWAEAHTRRSNVDLVATLLDQKAAAGDLIVLQDVWEGITFDRYYHGNIHWMTIPPVDSHKVHRNDLVLEKITQPKAMDPVLDEITNTLRNGHAVWLVGSEPVERPEILPPLPPPPPPALPTKWWLGSYLYCWNTQVTLRLLDHALQGQAQEIPPTGPVNSFEKVSVTRFSGYKP